MNWLYRSSSQFLRSWTIQRTYCTVQRTCVLRDLWLLKGSWLFHGLKSIKEIFKRGMLCSYNIQNLKVLQFLRFFIQKMTRLMYKKVFFFSVFISGNQHGGNVKPGIHICPKHTHMHTHINTPFHLGISICLCKSKVSCATGTTVLYRTSIFPLKSPNWITLSFYFYAFFSVCPLFFYPWGVQKQTKCSVA